MTFYVLQDVPMQRIRIHIALVRLLCVQFALLYVYQLRGETTRILQLDVTVKDSNHYRGDDVSRSMPTVRLVIDFRYS